MGAGQLAKLRVELALNDKGFSAGLGHAEKQARGFGQTLKAVFAIAGGFLLAQGIILLTKAFGDFIGAGVNFGKEMANVNSIAQLTDKQLASLGDQVIDLAKDPRIADGPAVLASGLYDIYSSGFQGAAGLTILEKAAIAATAGLTTTETSAKVGAAVLNAYGLEASDAGHVFDVLFQTVNDGVITFDQLANNVGNTLPLAAALGVSIEELGAAYAQMTLKGVNASQAETQIASLMKSAINPTEDLTAAVQARGYASTEALIADKGWLGYLQLINEASGGSNEELMKLVGTQEAMNAALILGADNAAPYIDEINRMNNASAGAGATQAALAKQMKSASFQFGQVKKQIQILATVIFRALEPSIASVARGIAKFILGLTAMASFFIEVIRGAKSVTTSFGAMGTGITTVGANITDALAEIPKPFRGIALAIADVINAVKLWAGALIDAFVSGVKVSDLVAKLPKPLQGVAKGFLTIADSVGDLVNRWQSKGLSGMLQILPRELRQAWEGAKELGSALRDLAENGVEALGSALLTLVQKVDWNAVGSALVEGLRTAWSFVKGHPDYAAAAFLAGLVGIITLYAIKAINWGPVASALADGIRGAFNAIPWGDIWTDVSTFLTGLWTSFQTFDYHRLGFIVGSGIRAAIVAVGPTLLSIAGDLLTWFKNGLENNWPTILKWFALWPLLIPAAIIGAQKVLLPKAWEFLKGFLEGLGLNWDTQVKPWLASLPGLALDAIGDLAETLTARGIELIIGLRSGASTSWDLFASWLAARAAFAIFWIGDVTQSLLQKGKDLLQGLWSGASDKWNAMAVWLTTRPAFAAYWIGDLGKTLWSKGISLIEGLWDGASEQWDSLTDWFASRGAEAASWVGDLGGYLYSAGIDLIQGLIDGIMAKIPGLQWAVSQVNSLIDLIDRGKSPWPMMIEAGSDAIDGLIIGMNQRSMALGNAISGINGIVNLTPSVAMAAATTSYGGASSIGSAGAIHIHGNIIVPNATNAEETARELPNAIARKLGRTVGV